MVPKPYDREAFRLKKSGSGLVFFDLNRVLPAVYFNHQLTVDAHKITNIWSDWVLPPELAAGDRSIAQQPPQAAFGVGLCFAQLSGFVLHRVHWLFSISPHPGPLPKGAREVVPAPLHSRVRDFESILAEKRISC
jgi:hypothetical protein